MECTVNRVGSQTFDQTILTGHHDRIDDLDRIAALGIRTLRYPAIWERTQPDMASSPDWRWLDARIERMAALGIEPILTLLHHGSGPRGLDLLHPEFPEALAHYAREVAARYPHVTHFTPINEPVTTARFSTLYGIWYPHLRDTHAFFWATWNQARALQLAMRQIRAVTPDAVCILTDDYGTVHSTDRLRYQADFENHRRWLALDLLFGRIIQQHPLWRFLRDAGLSSTELRTEPLENAVIGIDYYLTSERFLDHRLEHYPTHLHGGNGRDAYFDVEAARVRETGIDGIQPILEKTGQRYGNPVAVTEAFLGNPHHDRLRWIQSIWDGARAAKRNGTDVRAVTNWALLGSVDWDSLVTRSSGSYEPGAFDITRPGLPETDLARWIRATTTGRPAPTLAPGWWETNTRFLYPPALPLDLTGD